MSNQEAEIQNYAYDSKIEGNIIVTRVDAAINWMRKNSLWPMPMGLACCAIELMATASSRYDISRFGAEVMRFSARSWISMPSYWKDMSANSIASPVVSVTSVWRK